MKPLLLFTLTLISLTKASSQSVKMKVSRADRKYTESLSLLSADELWQKKHEAKAKESTLIVSAAVTGSIGFPTLVTGILLSNNKNKDVRESSGAFIGVGVLFSLMGIASAAMIPKSSRRSVYIDREIWLRPGRVSMRVQPTGLALSF